MYFVRSYICSFLSKFRNSCSSLGENWLRPSLGANNGGGGCTFSNCSSISRWLSKLCRISYAEMLSSRLRPSRGVNVVSWRLSFEPLGDDEPDGRSLPVVFSFQITSVKLSKTSRYFIVNLPLIMVQAGTDIISPMVDSWIFLLASLLTSDLRRRPSLGPNHMAPTGPSEFCKQWLPTHESEVSGCIRSTRAPSIMSEALPLSVGNSF